MDNNRASDETVKRMKRRVLQAASRAGEGHVASAFSVMDILWVLYDRVLRVDAARPRLSDRDRFVLSKGHASLALYAVLAEKGFFPQKELDRFGAADALLGGHPDCRKVPGVEASTGSLGHGFPMAVGVALALRIQGFHARVFTLIGDGEANEGSVWESALLAAHHRLNNLCCVVDYNHSTDRALRMGDIAEKFRVFGWRAVSVDGHSHEQLATALTTPSENEPTVVVAATVKGAGCKTMESNPAWHHRAPTPAELEQLLQELA